MLTALVRPLSPRITDCELTYLDREPIDVELAVKQHQAYVERLEQLGAEIVVLPATDDLPDGVFVEDTAVVLDEVAVIARPGALSRRPEVDSVAVVLQDYRPVFRLTDPATLDGGDVFRADKTVFVGLSQRTNQAGLDQLREYIKPYGYRVVPVPVTGCLHLKSACVYIGRNTLLVNRDWIDSSGLIGYKLIDVAPGEPWAADTLVIGNTLLLPEGFPHTVARLELAGFKVQTLDLRELQKAEAGVTCMSILFEA